MYHGLGEIEQGVIHRARSCLEAYQATIDLLPQFIWLGDTSNQRHDDMMAIGLAAEAATVAIISLDYSLALEWLEYVRSMVWNRSLMLCSPLNQLHSAYPDLATRLQIAATQLHGASSDVQESRVHPSSSTTSKQAVHEHRRLAKEYSELLSQARALPGFEDFLRPIKANSLMRAARYGPIVVINCPRDRCDALIIIPGEGSIKHTPLPNFNGEKAQHIRSEIDALFRLSGERIAMSQKRPEDRPVRRNRFTRRRNSVRGGDSSPEFNYIREDDPVLEDDFRRKDSFRAKTALASLWNDVVKPVLDALGYTRNATMRDLPHVTWCPTGAMTFLPLHGAGDYDQPSSTGRVFNYVISSYIPTLTALLAHHSSTSSIHYRVLGVSHGSAAGGYHRRLFEAPRELASVQLFTQTRARGGYSQLVNNQATITAVLNAMERHDWAHFVCHSHQNVKDPTKSGFFLHDGVLDLAAITRRSFKNKGLAFLSACQTGSSQKKPYDEATSLASGMFMAGYPSVIATMWAIIDDYSPSVARDVYSSLRTEGTFGNGEAGRSLYNAVARLRGTEREKEFEHWIPYIHIGS